MNFTKVITLLTIAILFTGMSVTAQVNDGLKKVEKEGTEVQKDNAPIKVNRSKPEMTDEDREDVARAKANANKSQMNDAFKKKKTKIDKANAKVAQLKAKFKAKLKSGDWSQEKFDNMMKKIASRESKIAKQKKALVNSLIQSK